MEQLPIMDNLPDPSKMSQQQREAYLEAWESCKPKLNLTKEEDISHLGFPSPTTEVPLYKSVIFGTGGNMPYNPTQLENIFKNGYKQGEVFSFGITEKEFNQLKNPCNLTEE